MEKIKQMLEIAELAYRAHERLHELEKPYTINVYFQFNCPLLEISVFHKGEKGYLNKAYSVQLFWEDEFILGRFDINQNRHFMCDMTVAIENVISDLTWISKYGDAGILENNPLWVFAL